MPELPRPTGWEMTRLGALGEVNRGRSRHRPRYASHLYGGPYPFIQTGDIRQSGGRITCHTQTYSEAGLAQSRMWPAGTMCITIAANIAETAILTYPACFPDSVVGFIADSEKACVYFVEYMFRYMRRLIQHEASGSVQDNINLAILDQLRFPVPPLEEQRAIAEVLGSLDDKIELNRQMNRTLEEIAAAIFKAWFVDFEPVKAKAAGAKHFPSMPQDVFDALPTEFVDSPLGAIPKGWKVSQVAGLCTSIASGGTPARKRAEYWDGGSIAWFKTGELHDGPLVDSVEHITELGLLESACKLWPAGTILFALYASPTVGRLGILTREGTSNQAAAGLIARPEVGVPFLANALLFSRTHLQQIAVGAAQQNINQKVLSTHRLVVPRNETAKAFSDLVAPLWAAQVHLARESPTLAEIRDVLLPKLLSGEIRVGAAEKLVEEVA